MKGLIAAFVSFSSLLCPGGGPESRCWNRERDGAHEKDHTGEKPLESSRELGCSENQQSVLSLTRCHLSRLSQSGKGVQGKAKPTSAWNTSSEQGVVVSKTRTEKGLHNWRKKERIPRKRILK